MADQGSDFDYCLDFLRDADRDRYLACLLVPEDLRPAFAALYAFNAEIARIRDVVHDPMPGEIRMQWWRDLILSTDRPGTIGHPVAAALLATIERHALPRETFDSYIDARIFDLYDDPMPDRATFEGYAGETSSALIQLTALVAAPAAAPQASEAAGHAGVALAVAGALLLMPVHRARGQVYMPGDILSATGIERDDWIAAVSAEACARAIGAFVALGREHLAKARVAAADLTPDVFSAFLPVAIAAGVFDRAEKAGAGTLERGVAAPQWRRQWRLWRAARSRTF